MLHYTPGEVPITDVQAVQLIRTNCHREPSVMCWHIFCMRSGTPLEIYMVGSCTSGFGASHCNAQQAVSSFTDLLDIRLHFSVHPLRAT
jgi:hypothetical protein